jgi:hypothetical protein
MTHSVVLLNGETGGFIVVDGSIKPIPTLGDSLRRHLLAVNILAQALEGGDELDSDHGELEALVVQAANLVLRRLQRSAGIEALDPVAVVAEPEQIAEPHETAAEATAETVVAESSEPVQAEHIISGEHAEPAVEAVAQDAEAIAASSAVEPEGNRSTDLEPIPAAEGESAHNIEASS